MVNLRNRTVGNGNANSSSHEEESGIPPLHTEVPLPPQGGNLPNAPPLVTTQDVLNVVTNMMQQQQTQFNTLMQAMLAMNEGNRNAPHANGAETSTQGGNDENYDLGPHIKLMKHFLKLQVPSFTGITKDPLLPSKWLREMEKAFCHLMCNEEQKILCAEQKLQDEADAWWNATQPILAAQHQVVTWEAFKEAFCQNYFPESVKDSKEDEFMALQQGSLSVLDYQQKFEELFFFAPVFMKADVEKAKKFFKGLRPTIRTYMAIHPIVSYAQTVQAAKKIEEGERETYQLQRSLANKESKPYVNRNQGRFSRPMPYPTQFQPRGVGFGHGNSGTPVHPVGVSQRLGPIYANPRPITSPKPVAPPVAAQGQGEVICFICKKPSHMARTCPQEGNQPTTTFSPTQYLQAGKVLIGTKMDQSHDVVTETMQRNREASVRCLQSKGFPYNLQDSGNTMEVCPELKDENSVHPGGGGIVEPDNSLSNEKYVPPTEGLQRPMYQQDFCMWPSYHPDFQKFQSNQWNAFENYFYSMNHENPYHMDNRFQYVPFKTFAHGYPNEFQFQEFQYFVVIDFEATCDKERNPHPQEIIEFPSVLVNSVTGQLEASFQTYVRPTLHQNLSDFCKELTGIQQIQVDRGVSLGEALLRHDKWLEEKGIKHTNFAVVTWSNWDCRVMLESECRLKRIRKPPYFNRWINLKVPFHEVFGGVRCNLKEAVQLAGLVWEGRPHCGLDDARNTARLVALLMRRGFKFSITNTLMWQSPECPSTWQQSPERPSGPNHYHLKLKQPMMPLIEFHAAHVDPAKDWRMYCYCGAKSSRRMIRKPGPKQGSYFFGCGNWTATRGALCPYFEWAAP